MLNHFLTDFDNNFTKDIPSNMNHKKTLTFDDNLIYSGDMLGSNVSDQNSNFNNAFYVGKFTPGQISNLNVSKSSEFSFIKISEIKKMDNVKIIKKACKIHRIRLELLIVIIRKIYKFNNTRRKIWLIS